MAEFEIIYVSQHYVNILLDGTVYMVVYLRDGSDGRKAVYIRPPMELKLDDKNVLDAALDEAERIAAQMAEIEGDDDRP